MYSFKSFGRLFQFLAAWKIKVCLPQFVLGRGKQISLDRLVLYEWTAWVLVKLKLVSNYKPIWKDSCFNMQGNNSLAQPRPEPTMLDPVSDSLSTRPPHFHIFFNKLAFKKYFWQCNFKKLYLCCYLQFHIKLHFIGKSKNLIFRKKKKFRLRKLIIFRQKKLTRQISA